MTAAAVRPKSTLPVRQAFTGNYLDTPVLDCVVCGPLGRQKIGDCQLSVASAGRAPTVGILGSAVPVFLLLGTNVPNAESIHRQGLPSRRQPVFQLQGRRPSHACVLGLRRTEYRHHPWRTARPKACQLEDLIAGIVDINSRRRRCI